MTAGSDAKVQADQQGDNSASTRAAIDADTARRTFVFDGMVIELFHLIDRELARGDLSGTKMHVLAHGILDQASIDGPVVSAAGTLCGSLEITWGGGLSDAEAARQVASDMKQMRAGLGDPNWLKAISARWAATQPDVIKALTADPLSRFDQKKWTDRFTTANNIVVNSSTKDLTPARDKVVADAVREVVAHCAWELPASTKLTLTFTPSGDSGKLDAPGAPAPVAACLGSYQVHAEARDKYAFSAVVN
jgi:hypothetical protein